MYLRTLTLIGVLGVGALGATSCSEAEARLAPAGTATIVPGPGRGAAATAAGVRVVARAGAWQWAPTDLDTKVTPLLVELQNDAAFPVLVRYNHIGLTDSAGHHFMVMPPYDINGTISEPYTIQNPYYGFDRFMVAPYLRRWYPRFSLYDGAFAYDASYYNPYMTRYAAIHLPTADMVQRALPEGVMSPGGHATGFIYFEGLHKDAKALTLSVDIVNATTGSVTGTAQIPFVTR